jgi:hypothetical protein
MNIENTTTKIKHRKQSNENKTTKINCENKTLSIVKSQNRTIENNEEKIKLQKYTT